MELTPAYLAKSASLIGRGDVPVGQPESRFCELSTSQFHTFLRWIKGGHHIEHEKIGILSGNIFEDISNVLSKFQVD